MLRHLHNLWGDPPNESGAHLAPHIVITGLFTPFPMLCFTSLWLLFFFLNKVGFFLIICGSPHSFKTNFKGFIYLFLERVDGKKKERERNIYVWLLLTCPPLGTWPTTQACALTGNWTSNPLVHRPALNPLSHTRQGGMFLITCIKNPILKKYFTILSIIPQWSWKKLYLIYIFEKH